MVWKEALLTQTTDGAAENKDKEELNSLYDDTDFDNEEFEHSIEYCTINLNNSLYDDVSEVKDCVQFICLAVKYKLMIQGYIKNVCSGMNICGSVCFFYMLRGFHAKNIKNMAVQKTLIFEICFTIIPNYFSFFFINFVGESSSNFAGPYVWMLNSLDVMCCSFLYSALFLRRNPFRCVQGLFVKVEVSVQGQIPNNNSTTSRSLPLFQRRKNWVADGNTNTALQS
ncbi:hypothetical protein DdX_06489 [Ditylenchus destructor]|uniref:Uncharacterized protein n=1 Tax=Ditylenchus destructor TaxID=166010 RepID=A0AAD4NB67_9BILA|nr:hypothetical protein DdX_06489 [Ditylenchus destructor]